jgi:hypothetical protein
MKEHNPTMMTIQEKKDVPSNGDAHTKAFRRDK